MRLNESNMEKKDKIAMQIRALHSLDMLAKQYGKNISKPATTAKEAAQAIYFAYLAVVKSNDGAAISFGRVTRFWTYTLSTIFAPEYSRAKTKRKKLSITWCLN